MNRCAVTFAIVFARLRASSHVVSVNGATSDGRWHATQLSNRIGATSFENVGTSARATADERPTATVKLMTVQPILDRKSTRLNSSHLVISYAVFCVKKQKMDKL